MVDPVQGVTATTSPHSAPPAGQTVPQAPQQPAGPQAPQQPMTPQTPQQPAAPQTQQQPAAPQAPQQMVHLNWSNFKPEFSGKPDKDAETHVLFTNDWMNAHNFVEGVKVQRLCINIIRRSQIMVPFIRTY